MDKVPKVRSSQTQLCQESSLRTSSLLKLPSAHVFGRKIEIEAQIPSRTQSAEEYPLRIPVPKRNRVARSEPNSLHSSRLKQRGNQHALDSKSKSNRVIFNIPELKPKKTVRIFKTQGATPYLQTPNYTPGVSSPVTPKSIERLLVRSIQKQKSHRGRVILEQIEEKLKKEEIKQQLATYNESVRQENYNRFRQRKFHPKSPWGTDAARKSGSDTRLRGQIQEMNRKKQRERERTRNEGRDRIGLGNMKIKKKNNKKSAEVPVQTPKIHRPDLAEYMKKQRRRRKFISDNEIQRLRTEEDKRLSELKKLDRKAHFRLQPKKSRKPHAKKSKKLLWIENNSPLTVQDREVLAILTQEVMNEGVNHRPLESSCSMPILEIKADTSRDSEEEKFSEIQRKNNIKKRLELLRGRVDTVKSDNRSEQRAAVKIQAWVRGCLIRDKLKKLLMDFINSDQWETSFNIEEVQKISKSTVNSQSWEADGIIKEFSSLKPPSRAFPTDSTTLTELYSTQMKLRKIQREKLDELKKNDLEDLRAIESKVLSNQCVMQTIQELIHRRYSQLNRIFDENIQEIQHAIQKDQGIHIHHQDRLRDHSEGNRIEVNSDEESGQEIREGAEDYNSLIERLKGLSLDEMNGEEGNRILIEENSVQSSGSSGLESPIPEEECSHDAILIESILFSIESEIFEELIEEYLSRNAEDSPQLISVSGTEGFSMTELSDDFTLPPVINSGPDEALKYVNRVISIFLKRTKILEEKLLVPVSRDPLKMLLQLQESEIGVFQENYQEFDDIVGIENYLLIEKEREEQLTLVMPEEYLPSAFNIEHIHNKMMFDSINELLHKYRTYEHKGTPFPWSDILRSVCKRINVEQVFSSLRDSITECSYMQLGKIMTYGVFGRTDEMNEELIKHIRDEKLSNMLALEIIDNDQIWTDYEFEGTQVKIDLSDVIFEEIVIELGGYLT